MPTVLVIEDDADIRSTLRLAIEEAGYAVLAAEDGQEGQRLLRAHPSPVVALVDHLLPEMTSEQIIARVVEGDAALARHVYIITTASPQVLAAAYLELLARMEIPMIAKPFDLDALLATIGAQAARLRGRAPWGAGPPTPPQGR